MLRYIYPNIAILRQIKKVLMPTKSETSLQMLIIVLSWRLTSLPPYGCRLDDCYHLEQAEEVPTPYKNILASICRTYSMNEVYLNIWHSLYQYIYSILCFICFYYNDMGSNFLNCPTENNLHDVVDPSTCHADNTSRIPNALCYICSF